MHHRLSQCLDYFFALLIIRQDCQYIYSSDETVWDFEFGIGIGIFRPKYRGIGIGFGIEIGMNSV